MDNVSLQLCWQKGKIDAETFLSLVFPPHEFEDFSSVFSRPNHDLLRPSGEYIGFSGDMDPSNEKPGDEPEQIVCKEDDTEDEGVEAADDEGPNILELEEWLLDVVGDPILDGILKDWLEIDGSMYQKSSVVAQRLKANRSKKVIGRTLRVQGLTLNDLRKHSSADIQTYSADPNCFCIRDIAAMLVRSGSSVCLAIIQAIAMQKKSSSFPSVVAHLLQDQESDFSVQAQIVQLMQTGSCWAWLPHQFLQVSKPKKQSSKPTIHNFTTTCLVWLCIPVSPDIQLVDGLFLDNEPTSILGSSPERTWVLSPEDLGTLTEQVWEKLESDGTHNIGATVEKLPSIKNLDALPYKDQDGQPSLFVMSNTR